MQHGFVSQPPLGRVCSRGYAFRDPPGALINSSGWLFFRPSIHESLRFIWTGNIHVLTSSTRNLLSWRSALRVSVKSCMGCFLTSWSCSYISKRARKSRGVLYFHCFGVGAWRDIPHRRIRTTQTFARQQISRAGVRPGCCPFSAHYNWHQTHGLLLMTRAGIPAGGPPERVSMSSSELCSAERTKLFQYSDRSSLSDFANRKTKAL